MHGEPVCWRRRRANTGRALAARACVPRLMAGRCPAASAQPGPARDARAPARAGRLGQLRPGLHDQPHQRQPLRPLHEDVRALQRVCISAPGPRRALCKHALRPRRARTGLPRNRSSPWPAMAACQGAPAAGRRGWHGRTRLHWPGPRMAGPPRGAAERRGRASQHATGA